ncbi:MAG TPA: DHA2 family efflux MFS transporter permease subunit [Rhizomicrobium sp.]|jgi:EmrB/QacA subfamily drug resistance transporter|nr:DHA2 family efflux MFS transporter permease subunit [Rhizomicrobium sp.]
MHSNTTTTPNVTSATRRILPWLVAVAFFMESLDTTILNTAVPIVAKAIGTSPLSMKAVMASYTLSLAVFIPVSGWVADRFGTRRVFASAIGIFTLGSCLCGLMSNIHLLVACRVLQGCGGAMMVPVGRLALVRSFPKSQLIQAMNFVAIPSLIGPMLGPTAGGFIVAYLHWRAIFFLNVPIGIIGLVLVWMKLPDYRERTQPLDVEGVILFGTGLALLSYVLEVFGDHSLSVPEILGLLFVSLALLFGYGVHAERIRWPLLRLGLFRSRSFAAAVTGSFVTRIGIGGIPFLLPLLYQVGLGFSPVQSGLLIMPQAVAAMSTKIFIRQLLERYGYRSVLIGNTLIMSVFLMLFALIGIGTPVWQIVLQGFCYGALTSMQYTSMNTLTYADVRPSRTSAASSIASTAQQLSLSFGVAVAGLATMFFVPPAARNVPVEMIHGLHLAFLALGLFTALSTVVFSRLRPEDGADETQQKDIQLG